MHYNYVKWWLPVCMFLAIAPFTPALDMHIERYFYHLGNNRFISNAATSFFFDYGPWFADAVVAVALIFFALSYIKANLKKWRQPALAFILTFALGAGVVVHGLLKEHWGRPRPKQVIEFGGQQHFRPFYEPNFHNQPEPSKSFACGHCTMGFCFFSWALSGRRMRSKRLAYSGWALAAGLGIALSITRMAQGGHFLSDTLAAALAMWLTALTVDWLLAANKDAWQEFSDLST